jgi:hypothetical protein
MSVRGSWNYTQKFKSKADVVWYSRGQDRRGGVASAFDLID